MITSSKQHGHWPGPRVMAWGNGPGHKPNRHMTLNYGPFCILTLTYEPLCMHTYDYLWDVSQPPSRQARHASVNTITNVI